MVILGTATVFLSMSRGGMVSMLIASTLLVLLLSLHCPLRGASWIMILVALAAFACVLYTGFDAVCSRLSTLGDLRGAEGGRWQIIKDITAAWTQFPLLGTGLGTHEVVYPMFARSVVPELATHAENEYAQILEETGVAGLMTLVVFGGIVCVHEGACHTRFQPPNLLGGLWPCIWTDGDPGAQPERFWPACTGQCDPLGHLLRFVDSPFSHCGWNSGGGKNGYHL